MILTSLTEENSAGFIYGFVNNKKEKDKDVAYISKEFSTTALKFVEIYNTIEALEKSKDFQENKYNRRKWKYEKLDDWKTFSRNF